MPGGFGHADSAAEKTSLADLLVQILNSCDFSTAEDLIGVLQSKYFGILVFRTKINDVVDHDALISSKKQIPIF